MNNPIDEFRWYDARKLKANDYNPNVVLTQEMSLLKFSLLQSGWIQPVLIALDDVIIDGFHRYWLSCNDNEIIKRFNYMVPVVKLNLTTPERMLLTIRINRAKGNHVAIKMHDLISEVYNTYGYSKQRIAQCIGASKDEIELLLQDGVFSKLDIKNHKYSVAWVPRK